MQFAMILMTKTRLQISMNDADGKNLLDDNWKQPKQETQKVQ